MVSLAKQLGLPGEKLSCGHVREYSLSECCFETKEWWSWERMSWCSPLHPLGMWQIQTVKPLWHTGSFLIIWIVESSAVAYVVWHIYLGEVKFIFLLPWQKNIRWFGSGEGWNHKFDHNTIHWFSGRRLDCQITDSVRTIFIQSETISHAAFKHNEFHSYPFISDLHNM